MNVMREAAIWVSGAASGASLLTTLVYAMRLRFAHTRFGWLVFIGMAVVTMVLVVIRYRYTGGPYLDLLTVITTGLTIPVSVGWIYMIFAGGSRVTKGDSINGRLPDGSG